MSHALRCVAVAAIVSLTGVSSAFAQVNVMAYNGTLLLNGANADANGPYAMTFELCSVLLTSGANAGSCDPAATNPAPWTEVWDGGTGHGPRVSTASGRFEVLLGKPSGGIPNRIWTSAPLYLQVEVKGQSDSAYVQLGGTQRLGTVPVAPATASLAVSGPAPVQGYLDGGAGLRAGSAATVTTCGPGKANGEGTQRYNYTAHAMEYCNGSTWVRLSQSAVLTIVGSFSSKTRSPFTVQTVVSNTLLSSDPTGSSITVPVAGLYEIMTSYNVCISGQGDYVNAYVLVNGAVIRSGVNKASACGSATAAVSMTLAAGDTVAGECQNNGGLNGSCSLTLVKLP